MDIQTERLLIRPFTDSDLPAFETLLDIPEVSGWLMQKDHGEAFLQWQISNYTAMNIVSGIVCFGIFEKRSGQILGAVGAGRHDDLPETEIFYNLLPSARHRGYATEAAKAVTDWAFQTYSIDSIIGTAAADNAASQNVLKRCGYRYESTQTLLVHIEGKPYDFQCYRVRRSEWEQRAACENDGGVSAQNRFFRGR